jgi:predicted transcriptional regulator
MTKRFTVVAWAAALMLAPLFGHTGEVPRARLPQLVVDTRGELVLDERGSVRYERWLLQPPHASEHIGMLMVLPARLSTRKEIAPFEDAMGAKAYDYRRLSSTSIVNLDDAMWGASLMVEGELSAEKNAEPDVHFVVDDTGGVRRALGLDAGIPHVLLYNCQAEIIHQHRGGFTPQQIEQMLARIDVALRGPPCGAVLSR